MVVGMVVAHLCLTLIIKELKPSVQHDRVVTTLNIIISVVYPLHLMSTLPMELHVLASHFLMFRTAQNK